MGFEQLGALINAALYLAGVFVAGFLLNQPLAWHGAIYSAGLAALCYGLPIMSARLRYLAFALSLASIIIGAAAGLLLI